MFCCSDVCPTFVVSRQRLTSAVGLHSGVERRALVQIQQSCKSVGVLGIRLWFLLVLELSPKARHLCGTFSAVVDQLLRVVGPHSFHPSMLFWLAG